MLWDLLQHFEIQQAKTDARDASDRANDSEHRVVGVQAQVERLTLASQAMWELLKEHTGLMELQLLEKMVEIDSRDGVKDGKIGAKGVSCAHCGKITSTQRSKCVYCGKAVAGAHIFKV
jgi:hypothetical protein